MSEESESTYKDGDIVWVKISNCWWPAEVKDKSNVPPDAFNIKRPPLVIVQFFNEDAYEFVKTFNHIYPYNSHRKNDFIKKGMDMYRAAKHSHMKKFPTDVKEAEEKTKGNPNILSDPIFTPQKKKSNIVAEIFGTPNKKSPKESKKKNSVGRPPKTKAHITHPRFLGYDDYEAKIRIQYPGKDCSNTDEEEIKNLNTDKNQQYQCWLCLFKTPRLEVMNFHVDCHIKGVSLGMNKRSGKTKKGTKRGKKARKEKFDSGDTESEEEEEVKRKRKKQKKAPQKVQPKPSKPPVTDIHTDILAEWNDDDEEIEDEFESSENTLNTSDEHINSQNESLEDDSKKESSCFDFDDEEEEEDDDDLDLNLSRKKTTPPPALTTTVTTKSDDKNEEEEEEEKEKDKDTGVPANEAAEDEEVSKPTNENESTNASEETSSSKDIDDEFHMLMKSTTVPELPEVPSTLKFTQNFPINKTIKFPDKSNSTEVATKLTNPKKRFVKSFEDFELQQNEQKRIAMESGEQSDSTNKSESPQEKEKSESPEEKDKTEAVQEKEVITEVVEEERAMEEDIADVVEEREKKEVIAEVVEEREKKEVLAEVVEEETEKIEISKLKCQLMSKIGSEDRIKFQSKAPRGKILETIRKEKPKRRSSTTKKQNEECAPKKAKYLKYEESKEKSRTEKNKEKPTREEKKDKVVCETSVVDVIKSPVKTISIDQFNLDAELHIGRVEEEEPTKNEAQEISSIQPEEICEKEEKIDQPVESEDQNEVEIEKRMETSTTSIENEVEITEEIQETPIEEHEKIDFFDKNVVDEECLNKDSHETTTEIEFETNEVSLSDETLSKDESAANITQIIEEPQVTSKIDGEIFDTKIQEPAVEETELITNSVEEIIEESQQTEEIAAGEIPSVIEEETIIPVTSAELESYESVPVTTSPLDIVQESVVVSSPLDVLQETIPVTSPLEVFDDSVPVTSPLLESSDIVQESASNSSLEESILETESVPITESVQEFVEECISETEIVSEGITEIVPESISETEIVPESISETEIVPESILETEIVPERISETELVPENISETEIIHETVPEIESGDLIESVEETPLEMKAQESIPGKIEEVAGTAGKNESGITDKPVTPPGELHIKYTNNEEPDLEFNIKTNLTNMSSQEEMSALTTLATMSELKTNIDNQQPVIDFKSPPLASDSEMVTIDGNLTVVSEKDLADGQVEITASVTDDKKKPVTLTNFSMDFTEIKNETKTGVGVQRKEDKNKTQDVEDLIPQQIICATQEKDRSKLMERLTEPIIKSQVIERPRVTSVVKKSRSSFLTERVMKPETSTVSVQKITNKRSLTDFDELDAFIIHKGPKPTITSAEDLITTPAAKKRGKAKILQQTIITPTGEIIQPTLQQEDNFDINSMPIVLSDQILTPENIESMPIYLSDSVASDKVGKLKKIQQPVATPPPPPPVPVSEPPRKVMRPAKIVGTKLMRPNSFAGSPTVATTKQGKYVIVTQQSATKTVAVPATTTTPLPTKKAPIIKSTTTGNKIMIITNQQGQQQKLLLTPAQQKIMGMQSQGRLKTVVKSPLIQQQQKQQQQLQHQQQPQPGTSRIQTPVTKNLVMKSRQVLYDQKLRRKLQVPPQRIIKGPTQKTIVIKNQLGQTVRRIQGTNDELLDQQVAEQLEAIKQSSLKKQQQQQLAKPIKKQINKKFIIEKPKPKPEPVPPLAPISPKKPEPVVEEPPPPTKPADRPLHKLIIQDAMGNQTTITEGQILALPSENFDGQPQSYMLVTLDETGNLTPLNNEALMSLDPNLGIGGDIANLQINTEEKPEPAGVVEEPQLVEQQQVVEQQVIEQPQVVEQQVLEHQQVIDQQVIDQQVIDQPPVGEPELQDQPQEMEQQQISCTVGGEGGQQLIVTGDPIATQKFLESLTEGTTDLANILANAEGSSILIQSDGQQILINTEPDNQMMLSVNTDNERSEGCGNPIFAPQPKNQDILAAALADTDVFQQDQTQNKQLSPNSTSLYPMNVGNVLETSLTLNSPIMTPLEVPSTNSKKIVDENDILTQVPKNVDLPITITDPNISHTVNQQQVANLMGNELLPETTSSNFVYSLPTLVDENLEEKPFNSSMPLLNEDEDKQPKKFLEENEGLCTLGGEICSSLSEPPPDMFDLVDVLNAKHKNGHGSDKSAESTRTNSPPSMLNDDSCEIPVQPEIVIGLNKEVSKDNDKLD